MTVPDLVAPPAPVWFEREVKRSSGEKRSLRILVLHWDKYPTAREVYQAVLPARGHEIVFMERSETESDRFRVKREGRLETVLTPSWPLLPNHPRLADRLILRLRRVRGWIRRLRWVLDRTSQDHFDFIQARDLVPETLIAYLVARRRKTRFAYQLDFQHDEGRLVANPARGLRGHLRSIGWQCGRRIRDALMRRADLVFVISETMRSNYLDRGFDPARVHVFPVGVGSSFRDAATRRDELRDRLGIDSGVPVAVYLGNLGFTRDVKFLLEMLSATVQLAPKARLMLLGRNAPDLEGRLRESGLYEALVFNGNVPYEEVPAYLAAADIGVHTIPLDVAYDIHRTMSPLKVSEYMAAGLAVVASPIPEAVELLEKSGGGETVEYDVQAFAARVAALCGDPERCAEMGRRGRDYVYRYKSFDRLADLVEAAYHLHSS